MKEKKWLKYLCLFALALLVAIPAVGVRQAQAATVSGSCGDSATYEYDEDTGKLTISGSGTVEYTSDWDDIVESVKTVVIGDKITAIGDGAFSGWPALKKVTLGKKVKTIGDSAFSFNQKLTTVDMGSSSVTKIGGTAFYCCSKLKTVTFSKKLTSIGEYAFSECSKLTSVSLPSTLKKIGMEAFSDSGLTSVTIPKNVTSIGTMAFGACSDLAAIKVSSGNTKYSAKSGVLYNKDKTKLICYPAGKSSTSFTVPGTVTTISQGAFAEASNLTAIKLNKVEKIGAFAFILSGLEKVTIPQSVVSIGEAAFDRCNHLTKIAVSSGNTKYSAKDGVLYNKAKTKLIAYPTAKSDTSFTVPSSVKKIAAYAFAFNKKLKSVVIGEKVTAIGDMAFYQCSKLKTVTIEAGGITIGSMAFAFSTSLKTVKFKGAAPESVAENAFAGVTVTIKYPSSGKSSWTKSLRSQLKSQAADCNGSLTFQSY